MTAMTGTSEEMWQPGLAFGCRPLLHLVPPNAEHVLVAGIEYQAAACGAATIQTYEQWRGERCEKCQIPAPRTRRTSTSATRGRTDD